MDFDYRKSFRKDYRKLSTKLREKFSERVDIFTGNKYDPILDNHSVDKAFPGCRSIDITGDCRAIFFEDGNTVTFVAIGTHAQLYK
jgi:mRNA-degrading endonuclease YafQ of YafQ-DinJ toxin-antitoxin module